MVHIVLDLQTTLDFYSASTLKQQSADRPVGPRKAILWSVTKHNRKISIKHNFSAQMEPMKEKIDLLCRNLSLSHG